MTVAEALSRQRADQQKSQGLAFAIEDLRHIRRWAQTHQLTMLVVLDHFLNGVAYEEMVVLSSAEQRNGRIMLWRSFGTVFVQTAKTSPRGFTTVPRALNFLLPPPQAARKTFLARLRDYWLTDPPVVTRTPVVSMALRRSS
jgi:hypothetical protein